MSPNILIVNLNRGRGNEFNVKLYFEENLDISNFVFHNMSPKKYELIGVVTHYGLSNESGHFIAYCKCICQKCVCWYKYNDAQISKADFSEIVNNGTPYLLFYHYME